MATDADKQEVRTRLLALDRRVSFAMRCMAVAVLMGSKMCPRSWKHSSTLSQRLQCVMSLLTAVGGCSPPNHGRDPCQRFVCVQGTDMQLQRQHCSYIKLEFCCRNAQQPAFEWP